MGYSSGKNSSSLKMPPMVECTNKQVKKQAVSDHTFERASTRADNGDIEVSKIIFVRGRRDSGNGIIDETFSFLREYEVLKSLATLDKDRREIGRHVQGCGRATNLDNPLYFEKIWLLGL